MDAWPMLLCHKLPDEDLAALEERLADDQLGQGPRALIRRLDWSTCAHLMRGIC